MYCPRCAVQNLDDAKFCRACGADIRFVPQALLGNLPVGMEQHGEGKAASRKKKEKKREPATIDAGLRNIFKGIAFLLIVLVGLSVFRGAFWLTIWFIIPALESMGQGIGQLIRARQEQAQLKRPPVYENEQVQPAPFFAPAPNLRELAHPAPDTAEIVGAPPSVTEMTTRHLDAPLKRAARDA
jgi:hypothetical protein